MHAGIAQLCVVWTYLIYLISGDRASIGRLYYLGYQLTVSKPCFNTLCEEFDLGTQIFDSSNVLEHRLLELRSERA